MSWFYLLLYGYLWGVITDIPAVDWVVQIDCPEDVTTYIHRVGRTARYANSGEAVLVLTPHEEEPMLANLKAKNIEVDRIE